MRHGWGAMLLAGCAGLSGQSSGPAPKFEVAQVQGSAPNVRPYAAGPYVHPDRYQIRNASMVDLVRIAYGVDNDKVLGGPSWLEFDRFDIMARPPAHTQPDDLKTMLQSLLAERFELAVHTDTKPFPAYALTAGPNLKIKEAAESSAPGGCSMGFRSNAPPPPAGAGAGAPMEPASMASITLTASCHGSSLAQFTNALRSLFSIGGGPSKQVVDKTDLKGLYDIDIQVTMDSGLTGAEPALTAALDKQLGLKLEDTPVPMPVVMVDRANRKPVANPPEAAKAFPPLPTEFDVVSLKPSAPLPAGPGGRGPVMRQPPYQNDRVNLQNQTVRQLINLAWNLTPTDTVAGLPKWADSDRYDVIGKVPPAAAPGGRGAVDIDAYRPMFQALLKDRFQMKVHLEDKPTDAYVLTAVKPKLQKADPANRTKCINGPGPDGKDPRKGNTSLQLESCQNMTMGEFAALIPSFALEIRTPVEDKTGLEGSWDFTLAFNWSRLMSPQAMVARGGGDGGQGGAAASDPGGGISLFDAISKQLGLKLETEKRPVPTLTIDHIEQKPTEN